eukprot:8452482-Pyramimonas_sp.AAC.1
MVAPVGDLEHVIERGSVRRLGLRATRRSRRRGFGEPPCVVSLSCPAIAGISLPSSCLRQCHRPPAS